MIRWIFSFMFQPTCQLTRTLSYPHVQGWCAADGKTPSKTAYEFSVLTSPKKTRTTKFNTVGILRGIARPNERAKFSSVQNNNKAVRRLIRRVPYIPAYVFPRSLPWNASEKIRSTHVNYTRPSAQAELMLPGGSDEKGPKGKPSYFQEHKTNSWEIQSRQPPTSLAQNIPHFIISTARVKRHVY